MIQGSRCQFCGAWVGPYQVHSCAPIPSPWVGPLRPLPSPYAAPEEDQLRRIIREELQRLIDNGRLKITCDVAENFLEE